jgi:HEAT repeat protein
LSLPDDLPDELLGFVERADAAGLAERVSTLGRRRTLAVRDEIVRRGRHAELVDVLLEGLADPRARVRYDCAEALDHLADSRCADPLREALRDPVPRVRRAAIHSLSCDACKVVSLEAETDVVALVVAHALDDPSIRVRREAATALGGLHDRRAVTALEELVGRESDVTLVRNARWSLRRQAHAAAS